MYPACLRSPLAAGLDGIRLSEGRRIDAQSSYRAVCSDKTSGLISPGYLSILLKSIAWDYRARSCSFDSFPANQLKLIIGLEIWHNIYLREEVNI